MSMSVTFGSIGKLGSFGMLAALAFATGCQQTAQDEAGLLAPAAPASAMAQANPSLNSYPAQNSFVAPKTEVASFQMHQTSSMQPAGFEASPVLTAQANVLTAQANTAAPGAQPLQLAQNAAIPQAPTPDAPPNPKPGECYQKVIIPAQSNVVKERVMVRPAGQQVKVVPARYGTVTEQVVVRQASEEFVTIPATYKTIRENIVVRPAAQKVVPVPPKYDTVTKRVLVKPAQTVWKKGTGAITKVDQATGEILCLVEEPAVYKTVTERVMVQPAGTRLETIPAVTRAIEKQVVDQPARVERRIKPAVTRPVQRRVILEPAREVVVPIPAEYALVDKTVVASPSRTAWISILCETNMTPGIISRIQQALQTRGFNPGPIDGKPGRRTLTAVQAFQKANGLGEYGLTMETVRALGVSF